MAGRSCLSLDLGLTTGYAVHSVDNNELIDFGEIAEEEFEEQLKHLIGKHFVCFSVAERPVIIRGKLGDRLSKIIWITEKTLSRQVDFIDPSRWKTTPAKKHPTPRGTSTHVKDAIRMGIWYIGAVVNPKNS